MDTEIKTTVQQFAVLDLTALKVMREEARENMEAAWKSQSLTTMEEGFTYRQAQDAILQALEAEKVYREICAAYNQALAEPQPLRRSRAGNPVERPDLSGLEGLFPYQGCPIK